MGFAIQDDEQLLPLLTARTQLLAFRYMDRVGQSDDPGDLFLGQPGEEVDVPVIGGAYHAVLVLLDRYLRHKVVGAEHPDR